MSRDARHRRLRAGWIVVAALFAAVGARADGSCPPKAERIDVTIGNGQITSPAAGSAVTIYGDETKGNTKVCWVITGLFEGSTLTFAMKEGSTTSLDLDRGKTVRGQADGKETRVGVPDKDGTWRYGIVLQTGGIGIDTLDPEIQVIGKGSDRVE